MEQLELFNKNVYEVKKHKTLIEEIETAFKNLITIQHLDYNTILNKIKYSMF